MQPRIPKEILKVLELEFGYSILIKGSPGTGKTTLGLSILSLDTQKASPLYITTRVSPEGIFMQFNELKKLIGGKQILDASLTFIPPISEELMVHSFENTLQFKTIDEFITIFSNRIEKLENPIVVIDSWDGLYAFLSQNPESNSNHVRIENYLMETIRKLKIKLILISESMNSSPTDYIVDAVFTLKDSSINDRPIRLFEINKVRSVERVRNKQVFTLTGQSFNILTNEPIDSKALSKWSITRDIEANYSTGCADLDLIYPSGGLGRGSFNLIEYDTNVSIDTLQPLLTSMVANFVRGRKGALIYSLEGQESKLIDRSRIIIYLNEEDIDERLRILVEESRDYREIKNYIIPISFDHFNDKFSEIYIDLSNKTKNKPVLSVISYNTLEIGLDYSRMMNTILRHIKVVKKSNIAEVGVINSDISTQHNLLNQFATLADTHFKIINYLGNYFLYGIKPFTEIYHLGLIHSKGNLKVELNKIS